MATSRTSNTAITFESHDVSGLLSVAHLFPKSSGRTGVYVLHFANGEAYVGQAVNVVSRWAAHRRRWNDIACLEFTRIPRSRLDEVERSQIRARQATISLRNISHARGSIQGKTDLDLTITHSDQFAWLNQDDFDIPDTDERVDLPSLRIANRGKYRHLRQRDDFDALCNALTNYLVLTVPCPRATELTFWALSALPSTNRSTLPRLAAVSINTMETLVIQHEKGDPENACGFINISKRALEEVGTTPQQLVKRHPYASSDGQGRYATSGYEALTVFFQDLDALNCMLVGDDSLRHAAQALNLHLMRKGPTLQWRGHCFDLAEEVLRYEEEEPRRID